MKQIVIYPGRFQPMLSHHAEVYRQLQATFPDAEVYIGTSDKTEGDKSPFNFKEKQLIAQAHGIDSNNVKFARSPYVNTFYDSIEDQDNKVVIFAVGEKDKDRFPMDRIDSESGLDMKIKPNKDTGKVEPKYYQMINTYDKDNPVPMSKRGYIYNVPNIPSADDEVASASAFRKSLKSAPDEQSAKEIFSKQFKGYNESIFNLIYNKIAGNKMNEDLNLLRQMAGLDVQEDAPVEFETPLSLKDLRFTPPSKSSSYMSIANRFPEGSDVNDPELKKEEFIKSLLKAPLSLLSEINERISPADENGLALSTKLSKVIDNLGRDGSLSDLDDNDRSFAIKIVKLAIDKMELHAGDDTPKYDDMEDEKETDESLDLSDIRNDYGIEEGKDKVSNCCDAPIEGEIEDNVGRCSKCKEMCKCEDNVEEGKMSDVHQAANEMSKEEFAKEHPEFADDWEGMQNDPDEQDEPTDDGSPAYKKYINSTESVEEGKMPAGLQAYLDKKNGKKDDADKDEDKEVDEDKDEDKDEVDEALNDMRRAAGIEIVEGAKIDCPCCKGGKDSCSHGKDVCGTCDGTGKVDEAYEAVVEAVVEEVAEVVTNSALNDAMAELKALAGI